ncbi:MAG: DUF2330 domain-containing protein [Myxococcota bacterium]
MWRKNAARTRQGIAASGAIAIAAVAATASSALAVCRVVEPIGDTGGVLFDPTTTVLVVEAPDQVVDYECSEEALLGMEDRPWERLDPATCPDGTPATAIQDTLTHVVLQPALFASGGNAGLIMPLPRRSDVNAAPAHLFEVLNSLMKVRVRETIEFVEDESLGYQCSDPHYSSLDPRLQGIANAPLMVYGCGDEAYYRPGLEGSDTSVVEYEDGETVEYEMIPISEDYEATVLNASSMEALTRWMDERGFAHDETDDAAFRRYVGEGRWFVAIDVHPPDLGGERRALAPLVVTYRGNEFPITHELSYDPAGGVIETDLFVMSPAKKTVGDDDAITNYAAPFQLDDIDHAALMPFGITEGFLTRLHLERRMADALQVDTDLIDAAGSTEVAGTPIERRTRVRIAAACCGGSSASLGSARTFTEIREYDLGDEPSDDTLFYRAPRAERDNCPGGATYNARVEELGIETYDGCSIVGVTVSWSPVLMAAFLGWRRRRIRR